MSKRRLSLQNITAIAIAVIGVIGSITVAYFAFRGNIVPLQLSISTTQTAEASRVLIVNTLVPTPASPQNTQIVSPLVATSTPSSAANTIYVENFDSDPGDWVTGNFEKPYSKQTRTITDGAFEFSALFTSDEAFAWANVPGLRIKNFNMSIDTKVIQLPSNSKTDIVIAFRYNNQGSTTYVVTFGSDSSFSFYSRDNGEWTLEFQGKSNAFQIKEGMTNTFGIKAIEQDFTIYANGQELQTVENNMINYEGEIGIGMKGNNEKSMLVRFDNIVITEAFDK